MQHVLLLCTGTLDRADQQWNLQTGSGTCSHPLLQDFWGSANRYYFMNIMNQPRALLLQPVCCRVERPRAHWRAALLALARLWHAISAPLMRPVWQQAGAAPILDIVGVAQHERPRVGD